MKSAWFWGTECWHAYLKEYAETRPECLHEWKSSPLANDHDFTPQMNCTYEQTEHLTQVIDLNTHQWSDIRKSYHSIIHQAEAKYIIKENDSIFPYAIAHHAAFGNVRNGRTYAIQKDFMKNGFAMSVSAAEPDRNLRMKHVGVVLWYIYQGKAYYASSPSLVRNVQHAIVWHSFQLLRARGVDLVEMGQVDGETEKEKGIAKFKMGFGGVTKQFSIVRRML